MQHVLEIAHQKLSQGGGSSSHIDNALVSMETTRSMTLSQETQKKKKHKISVHMQLSSH